MKALRLIRRTFYPVFGILVYGYPVFNLIFHTGQNILSGLRNSEWTSGN